MQENWVLIPGYSSSTIYEVSDFGRVRSRGGRIAGKVLTPRLAKDRSYCTVSLYKNGVASTHYIHRLVAAAFLGEPQTPEHQVNHKDFDPTNNHVSNLEWTTPKENTSHASPRMGRTGASHWKTKLTPDQIAEIKRLFSAGGLSKAALGRQFGISGQHVGYLTKR